MKPRETWIAYLLLILGGVFGLHKFYLNRFGWGILYFFTGGLFLVGCLIDLFTLPGQVRETNREIGWDLPYWNRENGFQSVPAERARHLAEADARLQRVLQRLENVETLMQERAR